jgi:hypothetical protein
VGGDLANNPYFASEITADPVMPIPRSSSHRAPSNLQRAQGDAWAAIWLGQLFSTSGREGLCYVSTCLRSKELHTVCMNLVHFCRCRGIDGYALKIRFASLPRGAPEDMNLNTGLQRGVHTNLVCAGKNYRFQYSFGLRRA